MSWFQRLKAHLHLESKEGLLIDSLDPQLHTWITQLADEENRSPDEMVHILLYEGLKQRQAADQKLMLWQSLTPRLRQAAALACLGHTNQEIAAQMGITVNTVKYYMRDILSACHVNSKTELAELLSEWDFDRWLLKQDLDPMPFYPPYHTPRDG